MRQLMGQLSPIPAPQGPDMGGMIGQGIKMFMDQRKQADQDAKMKAMIDALRVPPSPMGAGTGSGMFGLSPDQAMPASALPTGY